MARPIPAILDELKDALAMDRLVLSPEQAIAEAEVCLELETVAHALATQALATLHQLNATDTASGRLTRSWLIEERQMSKPEAGRRMKLARFLDNFPLIKAAYHSADMSPELTAAAVSGLMTLPPALWDAVEAPLVEQARLATPTDVSGLVDDILTALNVVKKSDIQRERRNGSVGFRLTKTQDGFWNASGLIEPETGELLRAAMLQETGILAPEDQRTPQRRNHDALRTMALRSLESAEQPSFGGSPVGVMVTMPMDVLEGRVREAWLTLPSGMRISPDTARRLACDAEVIPVVLGSRGEVLDIGRSTRQWTSAQRRAAWLEQAGRCAFPKCRRRCVELHHIEWWSRGGPTSLDNGAWLCAYHHWLVHDGGWTLRRGPDRSFSWTGPTGQERQRHLEAA